ncbi:MAG: hypothetical protein HS115_11980 [Spirochaetales bacterium]|nr:hypothetical protein [Spirochaetales bacterium]
MIVNLRVFLYFQSIGFSYAGLRITLGFLTFARRANVVKHDAVRAIKIYQNWRASARSGKGELVSRSA